MIIASKTEYVPFKISIRLGDDDEVIDVASGDACAEVTVNRFEVDTDRGDLVEYEFDVEDATVDCMTPSLLMTMQLVLQNHAKKYVESVLEGEDPLDYAECED